MPRQWRNVPTGEERRLYSTLDAACEVSPFLLMRIVRGEKMEVNGRGGEERGRGAFEGGGTGRPFDICPFTLHSVAQNLISLPIGR